MTDDLPEPPDRTSASWRPFEPEPPHTPHRDDDTGQEERSVDGSIVRDELKGLGDSVTALTTLVHETGEAVDAQAVATTANAVALSELLRMVRELRTATDARTQAEQAVAAGLADVVDAVRASSVTSAVSDDDERFALLADVVAELSELRVLVQEQAHEAVAPPPVVALEEFATTEEMVAAIAGLEQVVIAELRQMRDDVTSLKRRIAVRTRAPEARLRDEDVERIVEAVVERLDRST